MLLRLHVRSKGVVGQRDRLRLGGPNALEADLNEQGEVVGLRHRTGNAADTESCSVLAGAGNAPVATMSETQNRPPGRSTRNISAKAPALWGTRFRTQLEITASTLPVSTGICSISPSRNSTFS